MLNRKSLIPLIMLFFLALPILPNLGAPSYHDITLLTDHEHTHPQFQQVQLANGKFVYAYTIDTNNTHQILHVYTYSATGSEDAHTIIDLYRIGNNDRCENFVLSAIDSDNVLIIIFMNDLVQDELIIKAVEYNTNSYAYNIYVSSEEGHAFGITLTRTGSEIIWYDNVAYGLFFMFTNGDEYQVAWKYDPATNTASIDGETTSTIFGWTFAFFDTNAYEGDNWVYLLSADPSSHTTAIYSKWDLDNWNTVKPEILATHPNADDWDYDNVLSLRVDGGDILYNDTLTDYFLYWSWAFGDPSTPSDDVQIIQNRLRFNSSGIDTLYLEAQDLLSIEFDPVTDNGNEETSIHLIYTEDEETLYMFYEYVLFGAVDIVRNSKFNITDWYDFASSTIQHEYSSAMETDAHPSQGHQYISYKSEGSQFMSSRKSTTTRIYYGLTLIGGDYDASIVFSPNDDPPYTMTSYSLTMTLTQSNIPIEIDYEMFIDGYLVQAGRSNSQGEFYRTQVFTIAGSHTITIIFYDALGEEVYSEDFNYVFSSISAGTSEGIINTTYAVSTIVTYLPATVMMLIFGFILWEMFEESGQGFIGLVMGLTIGAGIGAFGGVLPYSIFFITLILCGLAVFSASRRN